MLAGRTASSVKNGLPPQVSSAAEYPHYCEHFLPAGQMDVRHLEKPDYTPPREEISQEALAMSREAASGLGPLWLGRMGLATCSGPCCGPERNSSWIKPWGKVTRSPYNDQALF